MDEVIRYTNTIYGELVGDNKITYTFQSEVTYQKRCEDSIRICSKYPEYVPVIINVSDPEIKLRKKKYLIPKNVLSSTLLSSVRTQVIMHSNQAMFLFADDIIIDNMKFIGDLYEQYKIRNNIKPTDDQFFYITLCLENTFG